MAAMPTGRVSRKAYFLATARRSDLEELPRHFYGLRAQIYREPADAYAYASHYGISAPLIGSCHDSVDRNLANV